MLNVLLLQHKKIAIRSIKTYQVLLFPIFQILPCEEDDNLESSTPNDQRETQEDGDQINKNATNSTLPDSQCKEDDNL